MSIDPANFNDSSEIINGSLSDHHCFGCGDLNPHGLLLRFRELAMDEGVWASFTPTRAHEGYLGMVHGGILSTMLDEAMSWAITSAGDLGVTAKMEVAFRKPVSIGEPLVVVGAVSARRRKLIDVRGQVFRRSDCTVAAEAEARFMVVSPEQAAAWREEYQADDRSAFGRAASSSIAPQ